MSTPRPSPTPATATGPAPTPHRADLGLLLMVVIWGVNFSVIKVALEEVAPLAFNALRFPLAAAFVLLVLRRQGRIPMPEPKDRLRVLLLGLLGNVLYQVFFIFGIDHTRAGNASLLLAGTPILTAVFSAVLGHESVGGRVWTGVALTVAGMALVVVGGRADVALGASTLRGDLLMIGASVAWSLYTVGARDLIAHYGSVPVTAWTLWTGAVALLLLGAPDLLAADLGGVPPLAWGAIAYAGLLGIGLAYLLWYHGVRSIGNTRTAAYSNLVPVVALITAWAWLAEVPTLPQVLGAAVIIGGVTLARRRPRRAAR